MTIWGFIYFRRSGSRLNPYADGYRAVEAIEDIHLCAERLDGSLYSDDFAYEIGEEGIELEVLFLKAA